MKIISILLMVFFLISCNTLLKEETLSQNMYRLKGTVKGIDNGEIYVLGSGTTDTIKVQDSKFIVEDSLKEPAIKNILIPGAGVLDVYLEPNIMEISINSKDINDFEMSGSKTQEEYDALNNALKPLYASYKSTLDKLDNVYAKMKTSKNGKPNISAEDQSVLDSLELYFSEKGKIISDFINKQPDSYVSLDQVSDISNFSDYGEDVKIEELFATLTERLRATEKGQAVEKKIVSAELGKVGSLASNFTAVDLNNTQFSLEDYRGKYVLLDFWAHWCKPCRNGFPHLKDLYKKYKSKGFEVIALSTDINKPNAWKQAITDDNIELWRNTLTNGSNKASEANSDATIIDISKMYQVSALPTKLLINPEGQIILRIIGGGKTTDDQLDTMLKQVFDDSNTVTYALN